MANINDEIKGLISHQIISDAANYLGESEINVGKAIGALLPTILGGLVQKSTDSNAFYGIFSQLSGSRNIGFLDNIGGLIGGGNLAHGDPKDMAGSLMGSLFGNKVGGILDLVSNYAGIKKSSSSSILGLVGPVIMGYLGKKIKNEGLNATGLASFMGGQKNNIMKALPMGMGNLLGFADMGTVSNSSVSKGGMNWWPWLIGLLALVAILYLWRGCKDDVQGAANATVETKTDAVNTAIDSTGAAVKDAAETVGDAAVGLGNFFKKKLACGVELNIPEKGVEAQVVAFIEDKNRPVDKETWFTMDRLTFETGKSTLDMTKSAEQLRNIAEILKCYPNVVLKIGGYTDNIGKKEDNRKLSTERANIVKATIIALGANPSSMEAEGYGDQYPKASNDTEAGRAQNRRIDIRVKAK